MPDCSTIAVGFGVVRLEMDGSIESAAPGGGRPARGGRYPGCCTPRRKTDCIRRVLKSAMACARSPSAESDRSVVECLGITRGNLDRTIKVGDGGREFSPRKQDRSPIVKGDRIAVVGGSRAGVSRRSAAGLVRRARVVVASRIGVLTDEPHRGSSESTDRDRRRTRLDYQSTA